MQIGIKGIMVAKQPINTYFASLDHSSSQPAILVSMDESPDSSTEAKNATKSSSRQAKPWKRLLALPAAIILSLIIVAGSYVGYLYAATPLSIREPLYEHYHFRMSLNVDGKEINFAESKYQEGYSKDNCNAALTTHPIHFHDSKNHFVHIHWEGMTGGQVLKYYGWNFTGGTLGSMGYRFDDGLMLKKVPIQGDVLPTLPNDAKFYVYTGNADTYTEKKFEDFTKQDLEKFFNKESNSPAHKLNQQKRSSLLDKVTPKTYAHGTEEEHAAESTDGNLSHEQLERLNNLIGDVVIFVQEDKPSSDQIKDRFENLTPLGESTCAG